MASLADLKLENSAISNMLQSLVLTLTSKSFVNDEKDGMTYLAGFSNGCTLPVSF